MEIKEQRFLEFLIKHPWFGIWMTVIIVETILRLFFEDMSPYNQFWVYKGLSLAFIAAGWRCLQDYGKLLINESEKLRKKYCDENE